MKKIINRTFRWMQSSHVNPHPSINLLSLLIMTFNELATSCHLRTCSGGCVQAKNHGNLSKPRQKAGCRVSILLSLAALWFKDAFQRKTIISLFVLYFHAWLQLSIVGCGKQVESKHLHRRRRAMIPVCVHMHVNDTMFSPLSKAV